MRPLKLPTVELSNIIQMREVFMKRSLVSLLVLGSLSAFAENAPKCNTFVEDIALKAINKRPGFNGDSKETRTTGPYKALNISSRLETYIVAASDEIEPSDWIVAVDPIKSCKLRFIGLANDGIGVGTWINRD